MKRMEYQPHPCFDKGQTYSARTRLFFSTVEYNEEMQPVKQTTRYELGGEQIGKKIERIKSLHAIQDRLN